jgi:formylglycine-generating enzyme required for sulfatase activity
VVIFFSMFALLAQPEGKTPKDMAQIPAGEFWMGRTYNWLLDELGMHLRVRLDDQPVHLVYLDSYWIDKYEITNQDYERFVKATGHRKPFHWIAGRVPAGQERFPVYNVTWDDAVTYCQFVGKRLPTEAEWERAARGGVEKAMFPWGARLGQSGRRGEDESEGEAAQKKQARWGYPDGATAVGSYAPNGFGLYDVTGNVWEWVSDWYEQYYYSVSPDRNPRGPETGMYRVIRGGGWADNDERILALHYRNFTNQSLPSNTVGFRCARTN